jgi:hypothetical protein
MACNMITALNQEMTPALDTCANYSRGARASIHGHTHPSSATLKRNSCHHRTTWPRGGRTRSLSMATLHSQSCSRGSGTALRTCPGPRTCYSRSRRQLSATCCSCTRWWWTAPWMCCGSGQGRTSYACMRRRGLFFLLLHGRHAVRVHQYSRACEGITDANTQAPPMHTSRTKWGSGLWAPPQACLGRSASAWATRARRRAGPSSARRRRSYRFASRL